MKIYLVNARGFIRVVSFVITLVVSIGITAGALLFVDKAVVSAASSNAVDNSRVIILDPGHGGEDSGAVAGNGSLEKDLNLAIAKLMKAEFEKQGYTVIMTRSEDKMLYSDSENIKGMRKLSDLKNRVKLAEEYPGATLVSVHMNSFGASKYSGLQVYYQPNKEDSRLLANAIQSRVQATLQPENDRRVKSGEGIYILEKSTLNSVLVECGFLTNPKEAEKLCQKEYQNQLSFAIVCGIIEYIETKAFQKCRLWEVRVNSVRQKCYFLCVRNVI